MFWGIMKNLNNIQSLRRVTIAYKITHLTQSFNVHAYKNGLGLMNKKAMKHMMV
jgi:hypothetical protein